MPTQTMNNDKKEINQGGHIWLDQCLLHPNLPFLVKSKFPPDHSE